MKEKLVMGLDIGTTSAKAVLFKTNGNVVGEVEKKYALHHPHPHWSEQDPEEIETAAVRAIRDLVSNYAQHADLCAVGLSSAMHSLICTDKNGRALSPMITWADGRSAEQAKTLHRENTANVIYAKTGTPVHPMSPLTKLIWMKETSYEPYRKADKFLSIKEYLLWKWFDRPKVDYATASAYGMFNIHDLRWEPDALSLAGVRETQLSETVAPTETLRGLKPEAAQAMGVSADLPFVIGGSDGPLANIGIGAIDEDQWAVTIGTSGAMRMLTKRPVLGENQEIFCYAFSEHLWVTGGPTNNGAVVFDWIKRVFDDLLSPQEGPLPFERLSEWAACANPGSDGLLFFPYLNGERAPLWNADASGSYIGLRTSHNGHHMIRACMEGILLNLMQIAEVIETKQPPAQTLMANGGFARSPFWVQMLADISGKEVAIAKTHQSSAWGAAWIALLALGEAKALPDVKEHLSIPTRFFPNERHHRVYRDVFQLYKAIQPSLSKHFASISKLQNRLADN